MPRERRKKSDLGLYHVIARGIGKLIIFEEYSDYGKFLELAFDIAGEHGISIVAYCLMDNHVHMLLRDVEEQLSVYMAKLLGLYARYFNVKYKRVGHLFQDRFTSKNINNPAYYYEVYRYIMNNPVKAGISDADKYRWSSYRDLFIDAPRTDVIDLKRRFPDKTTLDLFLSGPEKHDARYYEGGRSHLSDEELLMIIQRIVGVKSGFEIASFDKCKRDRAIFLLRREGLSINEIVRMTGLGRGVVYRVR